MYRATTPKFKFNLDISDDDLDYFIVTFNQEDTNVLQKESSDMEQEGNSWYLELTQEETFLFDDGLAKVQADIITTDGKRFKTKKVTINCKDGFNDEVIDNV